MVLLFAGLRIRIEPGFNWVGLDPDPEYGSRSADVIFKRERNKKFPVLKSWMFFLEG
jgi:hypothetical protein